MGLNKTKIAIIGAGYMADEYLKVLSQLKNIEIVGICNRTRKNSLKLKKKYGIEQDFNNIREMYKVTKPDGVIIALSPDILIKKINQIFDHNCKFLFEKPIGINLKESNLIKSIVNRKNIKAYIGLNRRYYSSTKYLIRKIKNSKNKNRIVEVEDQEDQIKNKNIFSKRILDNYMYVNSIHLIDYFNILCRGKIKKIIKFNKWKNKERNIYTCYLYFSSGDLGIYRAVWNIPAPWSVKVYLKNGMYTLKPIEKLLFRKVNSKIDEKIKINYTNDKKFKPGIKLQTIDFIKEINNKPSNIVKISESFKLMNMINKIY